MIPLAALGRFDRELAWAVYLENHGRNALMAPRVGFAGLKDYHRLAQGELDARADQLADRIDAVKGRGLGTLQKHNAHLDGIEASIDEMDAMVREGSNGPLPDAAPQSEQSGNLYEGTHPSVRAQNVK